MLHQLRVVIVGAGLIGGSLARALRPHVGRLIAVDRDEATRDRLQKDGVADEVYAALAEVEIKSNDLLLLALPVGAILDTIDRLPALAPDGCLLLDLGSTKWQICRRMNGLPGWFQAIGGHPMCGKETNGYEHSEESLFVGQTFVLTPTVHTTGYLQAIAVALVNAIGSRPLIVPPQQHDDLVAQISHLPYLLAATLMRQTAAENDDLLWQLSASGFRDSSRLAGSSPRMMRDIITSNQDVIIRRLRQYQAALDQTIAQIESADAAALLHWLQSTQKEYDSYRQAKTEAQIGYNSVIES